MWHFDKRRHRRARAASPLSLVTLNDVESVAYHSFSRQAKVLIRLDMCAILSDALLVAHTTLLGISSCGSIIIKHLIL